MKRILLSLLSCVLLLSAAQADVSFDAQTKYRFRSAVYGAGSLVMGSNHGSSAYLYYATDIENAEDSWWYIRKDGSGYTITNAKDGLYITYDPQRIENVAKGLVLSYAADDDNSRWTINGEGDYFTIRSVAQTAQWWNLRTDGSYLLGTYAGTGSQNELFSIIDEKGNEIKPDGSTTPTDPDDFISATQGKTSLGEAWERTGLSQPVVYTTNTSNPVLYSIVNLRRRQYLVDSDSKLIQTGDATQRTKFYFVRKNEGIQVFTETGRYVSTSYPTSYESVAYLDIKDGTTTGDIWQIAIGEGYIDSDESVFGYSLTKLDNLYTASTGGGGRPGQGGETSTQSQYNSWNDYNGSGVGLYDVDGGSLFVFTSSDQRHIDYLKQQGIEIEGGGTNPSGASLSEALDSIRFGGKDLIYDKTSKHYFVPIPSAYQNGGSLQTSLCWKAKNGYEAYTLQFDGEAPEAETGALTIDDPDCSKTYPLTLLDEAGEVKATAQLQLTFLPIVQVDVSSCNGSYYTTGTIRVTNADIEGLDTTAIAAYRYRGATAQSMQKKSYAIKLRDANGESVDGSYFGLRSDNNWILDAMAIDPACMRNRVSTDLWNEFSTAPYYKDREPKARTGTRGRFVEVMLNGAYHGLYCMTEKLDRKQLKLKKFKTAAESTSGQDEIHGLLYKTSEWSYETFMGHEQNQEYFPGNAPRSYKNTLGQETWASYELKYPDYEEEAVEWEPMWNGVNFVATGSQSDFEKNIKNYFDYPVVKDYYLFIELLLATDNHGKNMFYFIYDRQGAEGDLLGLCPWDLDGVWGARWDGSTDLTYANQDFDDFIWKNEHGQHTMYYKLRKSTTLNWTKELKARYSELRRTYFNADHLADCVGRYADLFSASYADSREQNRWRIYHSDIQDAADYMKQWIGERLTSMDSKYGYDPVVEAINEADADAYFSAKGAKGSLSLTLGAARPVSIYTADGRLVRTLDLTSGFHVVSNLPAGIYIVNDRKVIVE